MDRYPPILKTARTVQSKKSAWGKLLRCLFLLTIPSLSALGGPQAQTKPPATGSVPSNEKAARIIGPFLSREDLDEYTKVVLKNGLTAVIFERRDVPLAAVTVYVKAGTLHESPSQKGAADRVMRGVCFGRKHSPGRLAIQEISQFGGFLEGSFSAEYTQYSAVIPSTSLRKGMELVAEALRNPDFSEEMLPEENALALLESREILDSPRKYGLERLNQLMLPLTLMLKSGIREKDLAVLLASGDLQGFYKQWYAPGNIVLVICGSVDRRQVLDEVVRNYGDMVSVRTDSVSFPPEPDQTIVRYLQLRSDIKQALIFVGFQGPRPYTRDWYACTLLQAILAEGKSSKLNWELKRAQGLASSVAYESLELRQQGAFSFSISTAARQIEAVEAAVFIELEKIKNGQLEDAEIERAKNLLERRFFLDQEDIVRQGAQLARFEDIARFSEWKGFIGKIRSLSRNEIVQAARRFFLLSKANIVESLPFDFPPREITQSGLQRNLEIAVHAKVQESQLVEPQGEEKPKTAKTPKRDIGLFYRKTSGELTSAWVNHELTTYTVLHGPDVLVKQSQALPIISLGVFFPGGRIFETADNFGITELMLRLSAKETLRLSPTRIVAAIESHGAELQTEVGRDLFGYILTGTKPEFEKTLDSIASILKEPRFDEGQIENEKRELQEEMAAAEDNMGESARQLLDALLFDKKPYGMPSTGTVESMKKISLSDISDWHSRWVRNVRPIIVIAGDTDGSEIVSLLSAKLGLAGTYPVELPKLGLMNLTPTGRENIVVQSRYHSSLVFGSLTPSARPHLLLSMRVAKELLSGPGSGLVEGLRKARILPVIVNTSYEPGWLGSSFVIGVSTLPDMRNKILEMIDTQIRALQDNPIPEDEWRRAIALTSTHEIRCWQHRRTQVIDYARLRNLGMRIEELQSVLALELDLGRDDIRQAVKSIGPSRLVIAGIEGKR